MTSKAYVQTDLAVDGVRIALIHDLGAGARQILRFGPPIVEPLTEAAAEPDAAAFLRLREDDARALYEALGDHFGHAGHDIRALRRDYDAERGRVDKLIDATIARAARA